MIICILGESGSGKSTLEQELVNRLGYKRMKSTTTRPVRLIEKGDEYNFVSQDEFNQMIEEDKFIEYSKYNSWSYGLGANALEEDAIAVLTPHGLRSLKAYIKRNKLENKYQILSVYLQVDRKSRLIKQIQSRGEDQIEESYRRSVSDLGMYTGIEDECELILNNSEYRYTPQTLAFQIEQELLSRGEL